MTAVRLAPTAASSAALKWDTPAARSTPLANSGSCRRPSEQWTAIVGS